MSVSRVLNNSPLVNEVTRQRVLQAMAELNYMPNASARSLKRGRTKLIGILIPDTNNPIYGLYVDGIKDTAYTLGYSVLLCKPSNNAASNTASLRLLLEQRVTGVVLTSGGWRGHNALLTRSGITVACIDYKMRGYDRVTLDNAAAMDHAVRHLMRLGHRAIGMIAGPVRIASERERLVGYRRAMRARGLPLERRLQAIACGFSDRDGIEAGRHMLAQPNRPSALIVSSSGLAPGVLVAASEAGLSIPDDLALVGVGEMSWSPTLVSPITSLVEPAYQMGVDACRMLLDRATAGEGGPPRCHSYPPRLAVRISCGAPPDLRDEPLRAAHSLLFAAVAPALPQRDAELHEFTLPADAGPHDQAACRR
jgi:DNA-binding LacI/PurR family transcriptional regulator